LELYDALYLSYDGHIPGFFMAKAIKDNGRLGTIIENVDNPFIFFLTYQEVALIDKQLPVFDDEVTSFLKKLNTKYLNKPKTKYQNTNKQDSSYPRHVGDITFDEAIDSKEFQLCDDDEEVRQYFNFGKGVQYKGEKLAIIEAFEANYKPVQGEKETGLIRIRFIVNCKGQTGRFRIIGMDTNYQKKDFDSRITNQLLSITKNLSGWKTMPDDLVPYDYYQYLIFKMENGQIKEILP